MLKSRLCDCSDAFIIVSGNILITWAAADDAVKRLDKRNEGVIFKNCPQFIGCVSEMNNIQIDNAKYIDVVIPMYNLIKYSNNYLKTWGSLW